METEAPTEISFSESVANEALMDLNQKDLKQLAEQARAIKQEVKQEEEKPIDPKTIQFYVDHLAGCVLDYASKGYTNLPYNCTSLGIKLTKSISSAFKKQYPDIMVIFDSGRNYITCDWSGKNEV